MAKRKFWTKDEIQYLRDHYPDTPVFKLVEHLGRSRSSIYQQAYTIGLKKSPEYLSSVTAGRIQPGDNRGGATRFKPGHTPHNKGVKGFDAGGRSHKTRFMKGRMPQTWVPIGSERITKDGIVQRKVSDTGHPPRDWKSVHSLLWVQHHGPIPKGRIVIFKNGDRRDIRIENLELVTRAENMRRNSIHNLPEQLVEVCMLRGVLNRHINKMGGKHEKQD